MSTEEFTILRLPRSFVPTLPLRIKSVPTREGPSPSRNFECNRLISSNSLLYDVIEGFQARCIRNTWFYRLSLHSPLDCRSNCGVGGRNWRCRVRVSVSFKSLRLVKSLWAFTRKTFSDFVGLSTRRLCLSPAFFDHFWCIADASKQDVWKLTSVLSRSMSPSALIRRRCR